MSAAKFVPGDRVTWTDHLDQTHVGTVRDILATQYLVYCDDLIHRIIHFDQVKEAKR